MLKQKQFVRPPKKQKPKSASPETVDEFQEAADFHEDSGGKHRKGDPVKSARAFLRALDVYDQGLSKHPKSFDLSYNKARLQLEISENPLLVEHIGHDLNEWLRITLESHQHALGLDDKNPDLMFNTAQVLSSLAELFEEAELTYKATALWQQSLELLSSCLSRQEILFEQHQADFPDEEDGGVSLNMDSEPPAPTTADAESGEQEEQSATVETPISPPDLLDTVHAAFSSLISLTDVADGHDLENMHTMMNHLTAKASEFIALMPTDDQEAARVSTAGLRAAFVASYADAQFQAKLIDILTYAECLDAFQIPGREASVVILGSEFEARRQFVQAALSIEDASLPSTICWKQASLAQDALSKSLTLNDSEAQSSKADLYQAKGDIELLRHRIIYWPERKMTEALSDSIKKSAPTLIANAEKYYSGSALHADRDGDEELATIAKRKHAIASGIAAYYHGRPWPDGPSHQSILAEGPDSVHDLLLDEDLLAAISSVHPPASRS